MDRILDSEYLSEIKSEVLSRFYPFESKSPTVTNTEIVIHKLETATKHGEIPERDIPATGVWVYDRQNDPRKSIRSGENSCFFSRRRF